MLVFQGVFGSQTTKKWEGVFAPMTSRRKVAHVGADVGPFWAFVGSSSGP